MLCVNVFKFSCFIWLLFSTAATCKRVKQTITNIVIDHDGGADDAMAILLALEYEKHFHGPQVVALTTVNGNVNETQAYINTQRILNVADRMDVPIYRGASKALVRGHPTDKFFGIDGLGDLENVSYKAVKAEPVVASQALIELSRKYQGNLTIITLGPLTNIAMALKQDPGFIKRLKHIFVGAGNVYDKDCSFCTEPEFNVLLDVEAYQILAQHGTPDKVTAVPFSQIRNDFTISRDWRINDLGKIPTKVIKALNDFERVSLPKDKLWQLLDPAVMAIVLDKSIVVSEKFSKNRAVLCGDGQGINQRGVTMNNFNTNGANMKIVYSASKRKFMYFLLKVFSENYAVKIDTT